MDKLEIIAKLKTEYPTLTQQVNGEIFQLDQDEYEATLDTWANATLAKEAAELEVEQLRATKIAAYEKLGLTEAEIEALLPSPAPLVS
jgi:hypothetical protein